MAVMTDEQRRKLRNVIMRGTKWGDPTEIYPGNIVKAALKTAIDDIDTWLASDPAAIRNQGYTGAFKTNATVEMMHVLMGIVAERRRELGLTVT